MTPTIGEIILEKKLSKDEIINLIKAGKIKKGTKLWIDNRTVRPYLALRKVTEQFFSEAQVAVSVLLIETKDYRAARVLFKKDNHYFIVDAENIIMIEPGESK